MRHLMPWRDERVFLVVTGGRGFSDRALIRATLEEYAGPRSVLVHGDCPAGADRIAAEEWVAMGRRGDVVTFPANWDKFGSSAGPIRNARMVSWVAQQAGSSHIVLAFEGGRGTANCVAAAIRCGLRVETVRR